MTSRDAAIGLTTSAVNVEGLLQIGELALALLLAATIGLEREIRQKGAGLRTHALVGLGAALFMLVSKYGFSDVLSPGHIVLDPSRVAAQIVSGIGFIGAGLIFVRRDAVRGLTSAASIWLTAAVGAAAGAGLPWLAIAATVGYLIVALAFVAITRRLPLSGTAVSSLRVRYPDGHGILRDVVRLTTSRGFAIDEMSTESLRRSTVEVLLHVHGRGSVNDLAVALADLPHVDAVVADDINAAAPS
ncbi:MAG: MgtC/SapB family protein [Actinobacteria bacterium]|nr:MgtC/SapB family protein [Actinomycetota bacterium]